MAPTKKPHKAAKKEKVFHPESRKAGQLARKQIRKSKLAGQASNRAKLHSSKGKLRQLFNFRLILRDSSYFFFYPFPFALFSYSRLLWIFLPRHTTQGLGARQRVILIRAP